MKKFFQKINRAVKRLFRPVAVGGALALGLASNAPAQQDTQGQPQTFITVTNQPAVVTTTATSNIVSWVKVRKGSGLSLMWRFNQTSASTSNALMHIYSSVDGTNVSTVPFATLQTASTGTTDVILNTNWSASQLDGFDSLIIQDIANTTALTTLTNKQIVPRRPN